MVSDTSGAHPKSILNDSDNVFDVGHAYESGENAGTIISDRKKKGVFGQLKNAATELAGSATKAVKDVKIFDTEPEKPTVTPGSERKDVISKAVRTAEQAPQDDHDVVIERIRTFQKDAERVSGKPYLIQKNKEQPKSAWTHTTGDSPEPAKPAPTVTQSIRRTPEPKMPTQMERQVIPTRKAPAAEPEPLPEPEPVTAPEPEPIATPEPRVRTAPPIVLQQETVPSRLPRILTITGIVIVCAVIVIGGGMYIYSIFSNNTQSQNQDTEEPLSLTLEATLPLTQLATLPLRIEKQDTTLSQISIVATENSTTPLSTAEFLTAVSGNVPNVLIRALHTSMIVGGVRAGSDATPYLLFRANSFDNAFAGMLSWEATLGNDLSALFIRAQGTRFVDRIVSNQHVRVLYDATGAERLVYGFANGHTLIITTTSTAFRTVLSAL